jgi:ribose transport system substrate-binding protein
MSAAESRRVQIVHIILWVVIACLGGVTGYTLKNNPIFDRQPRVAVVTGGVDPFWDIVAAGARDAADQFKAQLTLHTPSQGDQCEEDQNRILRELIASQVDGVAVSPVSPATQAPLLNEAAMASRLVTFDSDAPVSQRLCYIGTDNYVAGRQCGELVKQALPNGGKVMISIGSITADNGQKRRQGLIDELLGRPHGTSRPSDTSESPPSEGKYVILGTLIDKDTRESARDVLFAAIQAHPDLNCLVGIYAYNAPAILDALKRTGRLGQIKVVAFDYHEETIAAIEAGHVYGTVVQDPYSYGFNAVRTLAELKRGQPSLPMLQTMLFECSPVTKDGTAAFRAKVKQQLLTTRPSR